MGENIYYENTCLIESMTCYIGKTVTVYTTSGGTSGCGFTGVLAAVTPTCIKLITDIGAAPACPIGSNCCNNRYGCNNNCNYGYNYDCNNRCSYGRNNRCNNTCNNWLGSVTDIPICSIACFTHHAI